MIPLYLEHDVSQLGSRDYIPGEKWDEIQREGDSERFSAEGEIDSDRSPAYFYRGEAGLTRLNAFIEPRDRFGYVVALPKSGAMPLSLSLSLSLGYPTGDGTARSPKGPRNARTTYAHHRSYAPVYHACTSVVKSSEVVGGEREETKETERLKKTNGRQIWAGRFLCALPITGHPRTVG